MVRTSLLITMAFLSLEIHPFEVGLGLGSQGVSESIGGDGSVEQLSLGPSLRFSHTAKTLGFSGTLELGILVAMRSRVVTNSQRIIQTSVKALSSPVIGFHGLIGIGSTLVLNDALVWNWQGGLGINGVFQSSRDQWSQSIPASLFGLGPGLSTSFGLVLSKRLTLHLGASIVWAPLIISGPMASNHSLVANPSISLGF